MFSFPVFERSTFFFFKTIPLEVVSYESTLQLFFCYCFESALWIVKTNWIGPNTQKIKLRICKPKTSKSNKIHPKPILLLRQMAKFAKTVGEQQKCCSIHSRDTNLNRSGQYSKFFSWCPVLSPFTKRHGLLTYMIMFLVSPTFSQSRCGALQQPKIHKTKISASNALKKRGIGIDSYQLAKATTNRTRLQQVSLFYQQFWQISNFKRQLLRLIAAEQHEIVGDELKLFQLATSFLSAGFLSVAKFALFHCEVTGYSTLFSCNYQIFWSVLKRFHVRTTIRKWVTQQRPIWT